MNRIKWVQTLVIILLILNLVFIAYFFQREHKRKSDKRKPPIEWISNSLDLNSVQKEELKELIKVHRKKIRSLHHNIKQSKIALYRGGSEQEKDSIIECIGQLHMQHERDLINHFADIKSLCDTVQVKKFDDMMNNFHQHIGPPHPLKRRKR